jgi:hypothetical protein
MSPTVWPIVHCSTDTCSDWVRSVPFPNTLVCVCLYMYGCTHSHALSLLTFLFRLFCFCLEWVTSHVTWIPVTMAWHVLGLQMEETAWVFLQHGGWMGS